MSKEIENKHLVAKEKFANELKSQLKLTGWERETLNIVNKKCDFAQNYHLIIFPQGQQEAALYLEALLDQQMLEHLNNAEKPEGVRAKIAAALTSRIIEIQDKEVALAQSSFFALPSNLTTGLKAASSTCDVIWRYAGDKSTDFNYYTKRGLLIYAYMLAKTYYFADASPEYKDTKQYIVSTLDNIVNIASLKNKIKMPGLEDIPILRLFS